MELIKYIIRLNKTRNLNVNRKTKLFIVYFFRNKAKIQKLDSYIDLCALEPDFFSNVFKEEDPESKGTSSQPNSF